jgi:hypothetical protein
LTIAKAGGAHLTTAPGLKVPAYPAGWRAHLLGRDTETGLAVWVLADLRAVDILLVLGTSHGGVSAAFALADFEFVGTGAGQEVWSRLSEKGASPALDL